MGAGVDCAQLLIAVYEAAGLVPVGEIVPGGYSPEWHLHHSTEIYLGWVQKYCDLIDGDPQPGDIAVFQFGRCVSHAGIVTEWPKVIHAYYDMGVIESSVNEALLCEKNGRGLGLIHAVDAALTCDSFFIMRTHSVYATSE